MARPDRVDGPGPHGSRKSASSAAAGARHHSSLPSFAGYREIELCSFTQFRFNPDAAMVPLDDALADRKTHACSGDRWPVKPLKHAENPRVVLRGNTQTIVS